MTQRRDPILVAWWLVGTLAAVMSPFVRAQDQANAEFSVQRIVTKLRERQEKVTSAKFVWTEKCFEAKGFRHNPALAPPNPEEPPQPLTPPQDDHYILRQSLSFEGTEREIKTNFISSERMYDPQGQPQRLDERRTFDGENQLTLMQPRQANGPHQGRIYPPNSPNQILNLMVLAPVLHCYLLGEKIPAQSTDLDRYCLELEPSEIEDVRCVVLFGASQGHKLWLDPAREFLILRSATQPRGVVQTQTDFTYAENREQGWVLSGWKTVRFDERGNVALSRTAKVMKYQINPEFRANEFTINFPEGTHIDDLRPREKENGVKEDN